MQAVELMQHHKQATPDNVSIALAQDVKAMRSTMLNLRARAASRSEETFSSTPAMSLYNLLLGNQTPALTVIFLGEDLVERRGSFGRQPSIACAFFYEERSQTFLHLLLWNGKKLSILTTKLLYQQGHLVISPMFISCCNSFQG
jgi:hypothetical protein